MPSGDAGHITELTGKFYVAAEICRRGFEARLSNEWHPRLTVHLSSEAGDLVTELRIHVQTVRDRAGWQFFLPPDLTRFGEVCVLVVAAVPPKTGYTAYILKTGVALKLAEQARNMYLQEHPGNDGEKTPLMLGPGQLAQHREKWHLLLLPVSAEYSQGSDGSAA